MGGLAPRRRGRQKRRASAGRGGARQKRSGADDRAGLTSRLVAVELRVRDDVAVDQRRATRRTSRGAVVTCEASAGGRPGRRGAQIGEPAVRGCGGGCRGVIVLASGRWEACSRRSMSTTGIVPAWWRDRPRWPARRATVTMGSGRSRRRASTARSTCWPVTRTTIDAAKGAPCRRVAGVAAVVVLPGAQQAGRVQHPQGGGGGQGPDLGDEADLARPSWIVHGQRAGDGHRSLEVLLTGVVVVAGGQQDERAGRRVSRTDAP